MVKKTNVCVCVYVYIYIYMLPKMQLNNNNNNNNKYILYALEQVQVWNSGLLGQHKNKTATEPWFGCMKILMKFSCFFKPCVLFL